MQVYRSTAKQLGLWTPAADVAGDEVAERAAYAELAKDIGWGIQAGVRVFRSKLEQSAAEGIAGGLRRYNGSGPQAEGYRDRALAFAEKTWGGPLAAAA
jgi:hypothetical protein